MGKRKQLLVKIIILAFAIIITSQSSVFAQYSSPNYRVEEKFFGTGGEVDASSTNYRSRQSSGSNAVGDANSTNNRANTGPTTQSDPFLEAAIEGSNVDFGALSSTTTPSYAASQGGSCNCTFYVRSYLSSGYVVYTLSQPPTNESGDAIDAKASQGTPSSSSSVEEFGINLVANTSPGTFGANLSNQPDNTFADGKIEPGYETANQFKYGVGDIIARGPATTGNQGIGRTNYTVSYIMKIANLTPAGVYKMNHNIVVVPSF